MIFLITNTDTTSVETINKLSEMPGTLKAYNDISDAWCEAEANFRLREMFKMKENAITDEIVAATKTAIRNVLDKSEQLYDEIDDAISNAINVSKQD